MLPNELLVLRLCVFLAVTNSSYRMEFKSKCSEAWPADLVGTLGLTPSGEGGRWQDLSRGTRKNTVPSVVAAD